MYVEEPPVVAAEAPPYHPTQEPWQEHASNAFETTILASLKQDMGGHTLCSTYGRTPKRYCWYHGYYLHWRKDCTANSKGIK